MNRILKIINYIIGAAVLAGAVCVYWFAWRVLPQSSGTVELPVAAAASIVRDSQGVPHIEAGSDEDAWFLQGYATAQDRRFQMDLLRRQAAGELAAVLGPAVRESDLENRRYRLKKLADQHARSMSGPDRAPLAAYARGVNAFLERNRGRLPVEFTLSGYEPSPWTIADSLSIALQLFRAMTDTWKDELLKANMMAGGDREKVETLFPVRTGGEIQIGSNAWVIAAKRSQTGKPILANDPHLRFSLPSIWYQVHMKSPLTDVAGMQVPGMPGVLIGHNRRIAWGMTILHFDAADLYAVRGGQVVQEPELVRVRGARPVESPVLTTRRGPVVATDAGNAWAMRWTGAIPGMFEFPLAELNRASDWSGFRRALARFPGPGANFVYADVDGNIGYQAAGKLPVRTNWNGDLPVTGDAEWDGFIPFEELPSVYNPESGVLITANQNPFPAGYPRRVHGNFAAPFRNRQIAARLAVKEKWRPDEMAGIMKDVYSEPAHFFAGQLVEARRRRGGSPSEDTREAVKILAEWNGQMEADLPAPFLATLTLQHFRKAILERAAPGKGAAYDSQMGMAVMEKLLRERPRGWFDDWDAVLDKALADAIDEGKRVQGRTMASWKWGVQNRMTQEHPVASRLPLVGWYFRLGPVSLSGAPNTISTTTQRVGPSMRFVADVSDWDRSTMNLVTGQSGHPLSWNYKDQFSKWAAGESLPMRFSRPDAAATLVVTPSTPRRP